MSLLHTNSLSLSLHTHTHTHIHTWSRFDRGMHAHAHTHTHTHTQTHTHCYKTHIHKHPGCPLHKHPGSPPPHARPTSLSLSVTHTHTHTPTHTHNHTHTHTHTNTSRHTCLHPICAHRVILGNFESADVYDYVHVWSSARTRKSAQKHIHMSVHEQFKERRRALYVTHSVDQSPFSFPIPVTLSLFLLSPSQPLTSFPVFPPLAWCTLPSVVSTLSSHDSTVPLSRVLFPISLAYPALPIPLGLPLFLRLFPLFVQQFL